MTDNIVNGGVRASLDALPGLKEDELVAMGDCIVCGKKQLEDGAAGGLTFYRVTISHAGFHARALQRRVGLEMQIGALASVMGPNEDLAKIVSGPYTVFVHEGCAARIAHLAQLIPEAKDEDQEKE